VMESITLTSDRDIAYSLCVLRSVTLVGIFVGDCSV
jgi:hypothetical protein